MGSGAHPQHRPGSRSRGNDPSRQFVGRVLVAHSPGVIGDLLQQGRSALGILPLRKEIPLPNPSTLAAAEEELEPLSFTRVPGPSLHRYWDFCNFGLEEIHRRYKTDWRPEDVYAAILLGVTELWLISRARPIGFFTGQLKQNDYTAEQYYFIWHLWSLPRAQRRPSDGILEAHQPTAEFIKQLVRSKKLKTIRMGTPRRGFEIFGFQPELTIYKLEL